MGLFCDSWDNLKFWQGNIYFYLETCICDCILRIWIIFTSKAFWIRIWLYYFQSIWFFLKLFLFVTFLQELFKLCLNSLLDFLACHRFGYDECWMLNIEYLLFLFSAGAVEKNKIKIHHEQIYEMSETLHNISTIRNICNFAWSLAQLIPKVWNLSFQETFDQRDCFWQKTIKFVLIVKKICKSSDS